MTWMLAALLLAAPGGKAQATEQELVKIAQALFDALADGKAEVWERALLDNAVVVDEFGRKQDKAEAVKSVHPLPAGLSGSIEIRDPRTSLHGDTAVLEAEMFEREEVFGQKLVVRYLAAITFVKVKGEWKVLGMMDVTLPTQPPLLQVAGLDLGEYAGSYRYGPGRAFQVVASGDKLGFTTRAGGKPTALEPLAKDVFMEDGEERNLVVFRRDAAGKIDSLIERRKFNDLILKRE